MTARTHAQIIEGFYILVVPFIAVSFCSFTSTHRMDVPFAFMVILFVVYLILWTRPVHCTACDRLMSKEETQISLFKSHLYYLCVVCGEVYEQDIFSLRNDEP
jgi:hypothetical protein